MTQNANPGPEDHNPPDEGEGQQSRQIEPVSEVNDPPDESEDPQFRRVDPGPEDDDPPPPPKRPQVSSFFRSLRHMLVRFFYRP